ncbi:MAG: hypothetical protein JW801_05760 [Bacteroidales bacterium]|nr:hypothetical protein [Bacteroidales bacterium]
MNKDYKSWTARLLIYALVLLFTVIVMTNKFADKAADPQRFGERLNIMFYALWGLNILGIVLTILGLKKEELKKDINFILLGVGHVGSIVGSVILFLTK